MYVINMRVNNVAVTIKFRKLQHAIERAREIALRDGKAGVKVVKQDRLVRVVDGQVFGWRGATRTYLIGAAA